MLLIVAASQMAAALAAASGSGDSSAAGSRAVPAPPVVSGHGTSAEGCSPKLPKVDCKMMTQPVSSPPGEGARGGSPLRIATEQSKREARGERGGRGEW